MKSVFVSLALLAATALPPRVAASASRPIDGTWSGDWTPKGGARDAVTVQVAQESQGRITGKFLTPVPMDFTRSSYAAATGTVMLEAVDLTSGKHYAIHGRVKGTEITGTMTAGDVTGRVLLIKWTYLGRNGNVWP